jgi:hypothetical protein
VSLTTNRYKSFQLTVGQKGTVQFFALLTVIILIGCTPQVGVIHGPIAVRLWVNFAATQAQAQLGETVRLGVEVRNRINHPIELTLQGRPAYDFVITRRDGTEVWRWSRRQISQDVSKVVKLYQRDQLNLKAIWDQVGNDGDPIPWDIYWVRGILHLESQTIETESVRLLIHPGPSLVLRLEVPSLTSTPWEPFWKLGQKVPLKLKLKNISDQPVELALLADPPYDFLITKDSYDGPEVWRWSRGRALQEIARLRTLYPKDELEFEEQWDQRDSEGNSILPGRYCIQGLVNVEPTARDEAKECITIGPGLPLRLTLEVPKEVQVAESVPLKLRIENTSSKILHLTVGYAPYDFIVTTPDGTEVWRWSYGKVFPLGTQFLIVQPGEAKEYSEMWEQLDNEGYPVLPGTYLVRGTFRASQLEDLFETEQSEPYQLVIKR